MAKRPVHQKLINRILSDRIGPRQAAPLHFVAGPRRGVVGEPNTLNPNSRFVAGYADHSVATPGLVEFIAAPSKKRQK